MSAEREGRITDFNVETGEISVADAATGLEATTIPAMTIQRGSAYITVVPYDAGLTALGLITPSEDPMNPSVSAVLLDDTARQRIRELLDD